MELLSDTLEIPSSVTTPCMTHSTVFTDMALDADPKIWTTLDPDEQFELAESKREAQDRAVALCAGCPILSECRSWAENNDVLKTGLTLPGRLALPLPACTTLRSSPLATPWRLAVA